MTQKAIIEKHFSKLADVWKDNIYKPIHHQGVFDYFDKQYRFDHVVRMIGHIPEKKGKALDVGCGAGQLLPVLYNYNYDVFAIDVSEAMLSRAREVCQKHNIHANIEWGDCEKLKYPDSFFDLYVAMGVIEYMDTDTPMIHEIYRLLTPDGTAIVTTRNIRCLHIRWRNFFQKNIETPLKNLVRFISKRPLKEYGGISREHDPSRLCQLIKEQGFDVVEQRYVHFHFLPAPLDRWLKPVEAIVGKWMERHFGGAKFSFLASAYIVKFQKK
ncbi:MAG: class I SAM-dependent methyltransferase [Candidatus Omnitrophica bacterium]|nr:class I SAM-dependent methyltransferase [Candidatus Omnitrophota bacterium]